MKRILLTGLSGTGKSTTITALRAHGAGVHIACGLAAIDLDCDEYSEWATLAAHPDLADAAGAPVEPDRDWVWRLDRVQTLLDTESAPVLFVSGCAANMRPLLPRFDAIILLTVSAEVMAHRLRTRTNGPDSGNPYGRDPAELARALSLIDTVQPLLRQIATHEIDTSLPLEQVVETVLRIAGEDRMGHG